MIAYFGYHGGRNSLKAERLAAWMPVSTLAAGLYSGGCGSGCNSCGVVPWLHLLVVDSCQ